MGAFRVSGSGVAISRREKALPAVTTRMPVSAVPGLGRAVRVGAILGLDEFAGPLDVMREGNHSAADHGEHSDLS